MSYLLDPSVDDKIAEYFSVDRATGIIFLKKSLLLDPEKELRYGVSNGFAFCLM